MKLNDVDFETYLKNYPSEDGYFGRFGGAYIPDELKPAFEEITNAYQTICHSSQFINELRRIRKESMHHRHAVAYVESQLTSILDTRIHCRHA